MFRSLVGFAIVGIALYLLVSGAMGTLTPSSGLPVLRDVGIYAALPLILIVFAISLTESGPLRLLFSIVLIAAIAALGYLALALFV